jgi:hypothetical protein
MDAPAGKGRTAAPGSLQSAGRPHPRRRPPGRGYYRKGTSQGPPWPSGALRGGCQQGPCPLRGPGPRAGGPAPPSPLRASRGSVPATCRGGTGGQPEAVPGSAPLGMWSGRTMMAHHPLVSRARSLAGHDWMMATKTGSIQGRLEIAAQRLRVRPGVRRRCVQFSKRVS